MNEMELSFSWKAHRYLLFSAPGMSFAIGSDTIIRTEQIDFPKTKKRVKSHASNPVHRAPSSWVSNLEGLLRITGKSLLCYSPSFLLQSSTRRFHYSGTHTNNHTMANGVNHVLFLHAPVAPHH